MENKDVILIYEEIMFAVITISQELGFETVDELVDFLQENEKKRFFIKYRGSKE